MIITHFNMQRIVSVLVVGIKKAETLSKIYYYIKDHFQNCFRDLQSNHDQGSLIF